MIRPPATWIKYWHVINIGIQNTLAYRVHFLFRSVFTLIPLLAHILLWKTIFSGKADGETVGNYELPEMVSYYLLILIVHSITAVNEDDWQIAADIRNGVISQLLLKPMDYMAFRLSLFFANRVIYLVVAAIPVGIFLFWQRDYWSAPASQLALVLSLLSLVLTGLLQFLMSFTMALLAFWVLEVASFIFILYAFEYVAGGHLFPIDLLPGWLETFLYWTPFPYLLSFPVMIYLGRVEGAALWQGLTVQVVWLVIVWVMARWVWQRGIRSYTAVGG
ncbi:MAG: ABC-2 family transporter protein [Verrucomicrobiota bacterium]|nr:ABC-2 family transporter protein [Verrucomicrobiota bacterium]